MVMAPEVKFEISDLRFLINNHEYPGIHVHIVSNDLRGHGLQTTSEVI